MQPTGQTPAHLVGIGVTPYTTDTASNAPGTPGIAAPSGPSGAFSVARSALPVPSANLSSVWENRARNARKKEDAWRRQGKVFATEEAFFKGRAMAFELCAYESRRHAACPTMRQPEENITDEPTATRRKDEAMNAREIITKGQTVAVGSGGWFSFFP